MSVSRAELIEIADQLGHRQPTMYSNPSETKWFISCSCGYVCVARRNQVLALEAGIVHVLGAARKFIRDSETAGVSVDQRRELLAK